MPRGAVRRWIPLPTSQDPVKGDRLDQGIGDQLIADHCPGPGDHVQHALGQTGLLQHLGHPHRAQRRQRGRLDGQAVSGNQRRGHLPDRNGNRKIPGRQQGHHAQRLAEGIAEHALPFRGDRLAAQPGAFGPEIAQDVDGAAHFPAGFRQRLPLFPGHLGGHLPGPLFQQLGGPHEDGAAQGSRHLGPGRLSPARRLQSLPYVRRRGRLVARHHFLGVGGIDALERFPGRAFHPLPSNEVPESLRHASLRSWLDGIFLAVSGRRFSSGGPS